MKTQSNSIKLYFTNLNTILFAMRYLSYATFLLLLTFMACNSDAPNTEVKTENKTAKEQEDMVDKMEPLAPLNLEPQATFDQSQMTNNALGLCLQFKNLDAADRKEVFEKLSPILPDCPTSTGDNGETVTNTGEAVQIMTANMLEELLGKPDEMDEKGNMGYYLTADESYKVVFTRNAQNAMACRYYEGTS